MADQSVSRPDAHEPLRLALRPRDAARALGISPRLLWTLTQAGRVPCVRLGRAVIYPVDGLSAWLADESAKGSKR